MIRDILLQATGVCKSAKTSYTFHPAGIDCDGHIAYDLHAQRFLELHKPLHNLKLQFTIDKNGEISQENRNNGVKWHNPIEDRGLALKT